MKQNKKILLDQYHLNLYIRPNYTPTDKDRKKIRRLARTYLSMLAKSITEEMENKIKAEITQ